MTSELSPAQVADYLEASCALIEAELRALGDDAGWHQAPDEWCARAVVGHLCEAEKRGFAGRIRIILATDHPALQGWDQVEVERERNDCARVTDSVWMEFMGLRQDSVRLVRSLKPADLDRGGVHPKVRRAEGPLAPARMDLARPQPHQAAALDRPGARLAAHGQFAIVQGRVSEPQLCCGE